jgi:hypothetical protein
MHNEELRVLDAHGIAQAQWAILFSTNYYSPLSSDVILASAAAELPQEWNLSDVAAALQECFDRDWVQSMPTQNGEGVVLSDEGLRIKESVGEDLLATFGTLQMA